MKLQILNFIVYALIVILSFVFFYSFNPLIIIVANIFFLSVLFIISSFYGLSLNRNPIVQRLIFFLLGAERKLMKI
ncbi:MAG: hypothetical protein CVV49_20755 [Spirochaetae bacterium HGW-Spirochaetae-5]|nr:MAG: hypothetical protein CVV49_20755 [Spirochaetae bacterium HGW-Spirochaetae-5]